MFSSLRLRLTLLYLLAALALIVLIGGGAYWLVGSYFRTTPDLALQHRMAHEFVRFGAVALCGGCVEALRKDDADQDVMPLLTVALTSRVPA